MDKILDDEETLTAYHEAGHAVIGYALGGCVDSLQLGGEADDHMPKRFGDCRIVWGRVDPNTDWQRQREILTILAGPAAEMLYRGERFHPQKFGPWQDDWQHAWKIAGDLAEDTVRRNRMLCQLLLRLEALMRRDQCWAAIAALADELLAHDFLEREQAHEILEFWIR